VRRLTDIGLDAIAGFRPAASFEELAASQGARPVTDFDSLLGHPSSEDESAEEFSSMLREWRREGSNPPLRR